MRGVFLIVLLALIGGCATQDNTLACHRQGAATRCSDRSATNLVGGRWYYRPAPSAVVR
jgi:hypothetical protein